MSKPLREFESDSYSLFLFGINSPLTEQKYVPRLNKFFDFINLKGKGPISLRPDYFKLKVYCYEVNKIILMFVYQMVLL